MGKFPDQLLRKMLLATLMLSVGIVALPATLMAAEPVSEISNQARKSQDPEKIRKAMYALIQKAKIQQTQMQEWHRKARLAKTKSQAQERRVARANGVTEAWRKFCQMRVAMLRTPEGINTPVSMRVLDSCSSGTNFPLNGQ